MFLKHKTILKLFSLVLAFSFAGTLYAAEYTDNFDTNPYGGRWTNQMQSGVWNSGLGEFNINNDNDVAIRYSSASPGSIEHEAQVTGMAFTGERLVGPGVRFDNTGGNNMYGVTIENGGIIIYRYNAGVRNPIASLPLGVPYIGGNFYSIRLTASGTTGNAVTLNIWVQDHGSTKPSDPGWIGVDSSPNGTYTDTSATGSRLDGSQYSQVGLSGRASVTSNVNRYDYFKTRNISDRTGVINPTPSPTPTPTPTPSPTPTPNPTPSPTPTPTPTPSPTPTPNPTPSGGRLLYVNSVTGNDSVTYVNNSSSNPWRSIGRAAWGSTNRDARNGAEAAKAGDTVIVAAGTYTGTGTNSRNEVLYYTENNGTPGSPITFLANGLVVLTQSGAGAVFGSYNRNYVTWDGFYIDEANALSVPDTGPVVVSGSNGITLQNLTIIGNGTAFNRMDNHPGIRIESSTNVTVRNTRISNFYTAHNVNNGACIQTYLSYGLLIENNEMHHCGTAIFLKGGPWSGYASISSTIRYNYIHDIGENRAGALLGNGIAGHAGAPYTAQNPLRIYQNILKNINENAFLFWPLDPTDPTGSPQYLKFQNNVADNVGAGVGVQSPLNVSSGHTVWNNIIINANHGIGYNDAAPNIIKNRIDLEHNVYYNTSVFAEIGNGTTYTLPTWRSTYGQDAASPLSITSNPLFVSTTDYHLQSGSPARTLGVDYLDLNNNGSTNDIIPAGAYITGNEVIGINTGGVSPSPSPTPTPTPPPPTPTPTPLAGDLNVDHVINSLDWSIMNSQWFTGNSQSDLRVDGQVNSLDFAILSSNWGRTW